MSKFKGTPGPWIVDGSVTRGDADHLGSTVAVASTLNVAWPFGRRAIKEEPYNAHLIAAAPELLEAAQIALSIAESWIHDQLDGTSQLEIALRELSPVRDAIARALGEDQ